MEPTAAASAHAAEGPPQPAPDAPAITAGRLFSRTVEVWWRHAIRFGAMGAIFVAPSFYALVFLVFILPATRGSFPDWRAATPYLSLAVPVGAVLVGGLSHGASEHLAGRRVRVFGMLAAAFRRAFPAAGVGVLVAFAVVGGLALLVVPGIVIAAALTVALPAAVLERRGPLDALVRSNELTRGHRVPLLLALAGLVLLQVGVASAADRVVPHLVDSIPAPGPAALIVDLVLVAGVQLVMLPLPLLLPAVAYHELVLAASGGADPALAQVFD